MTNEHVAARVLNAVDERQHEMTGLLTELVRIPSISGTSDENEAIAHAARLFAARGLDVDHVGRVINYHLPQQLENYIHRVGRTARAGRKGVVINLVTERDEPIMTQIAELGAKPPRSKR